MRKAAKRILLALAATVAVIALALPFALPPVVKVVAEKKLAEFGFPTRVSLKLGYGWHKGPELSGRLEAALLNAPWKLAARFGAGFGNWHAEVSLPETSFSEADPLLAKLLAENPLESVSNLVFSGNIALNASVERTWSMPVPVWSAKVPIRIDHVGLIANETEIAATGISLAPAVSGIADHVDIAPLFLRTATIDAAGLVLSNVYASARAEKKALLVTEAGADFCGGKVNLYSLFINPQTLNTGFTVFVDNVAAGEILTHIQGFSGEASGRLHGKARLFIKEGGKAIRLSDAFLYSTPGETGKLKMREPETVTDNLTMAGLDAATCDNVANALTDLDYSVLRFDLKRLEGKNATLGIRIEGSATRGDLTVPVNLNININGELEQLINTGLGYSNKLKGTSK